VHGSAGMISTIVRSFEMNIMSRGISVFFIQKLWGPSFSKMKSIPQSAHNSSLYIRPRAISLSVLAVSIVIFSWLISTKFLGACRSSVEIIRMAAIMTEIRINFGFMVFRGAVRL